MGLCFFDRFVARLRNFGGVGGGVVEIGGGGVGDL